MLNPCDAGVQGIECALVSRFVRVFGSQMHYYENGGAGATLLFIHGAPLSAYLWRHVICYIVPLLRNSVHCIALDLIGMGKSDKPPLDYTTCEHVQYVHAFIEALHLKNITLVLQGSGSMIGLDYAARHALNVEGIVLYESVIRAGVEWNMLSFTAQQLLMCISHPARRLAAEADLFKKLLPPRMLQLLSPEVLRVYEEPFLAASGCKPLWQYISELPSVTPNKKIAALVKNYSKWLEDSTIPKLLLYAMPGFTTTIASLCWAKQRLKNMQLIEIEGGVHYLPESKPLEFATKIKNWYEAKVRI